MNNKNQQGYFFAVVGPSGAGKDSLIDGARDVLAADQYTFAKRVVTRPAGQVGEDYESCTKKEFAARAKSGQFVLTWQAHGFHYGLKKTLLAAQSAGQHIIANCSRQLLATLQRTVDNLVVLSIWASPETLAKRLHQRGRETEEEIKHRLAREAGSVPSDIHIIQVDNNGTLENGKRHFLMAVEKIAASKAIN